MGHKRDRTGIEGFFDDLTGEGKDVESVVGTSRKSDEKSIWKSVGESAGKSETKSTETRKDRRKTDSKLDLKTESTTDVERKDEEPAKRTTPTGRPAGTKAGAGPLKRRATLWLPAELIDAYRDRTWEERCHLGELVERALREYRERNWGATP